jgi:hypothetical protein
MQTSKQTWNWITDAILMIGFVVAFFLDLTGLSLHQWLGVALGLLAGYHFVSHWDWVQSVAGRFLGRTSRQARRYFLMDAGLMLGFALILVTGLVISSWLALALENYAAWKNIHVIASIATLLIVVVKIGLHWRWIVKTAERFFAPAPPAVASLPMQPVHVSATMDRRSFLALMGIVGVATVVAISHVLDDEKSVLAESVASSSVSEETSQAIKTGSALASASASSSACVVRCNKGCSYPGHCRRYVDTNGNKRCDMGECM